jgi:3-hydroxymyristoyl/3-hydroxydecanoyl-(acyl carrier protein) dehydratase
LKRIKFSNMVRPGNCLRLELRYNEERQEIGFTALNPGGDISYASGTIRLEAAR